MDLINLNSFLKFGYFLNYHNSKIDISFSNINKRMYENVPENQLVDIGVKFWKDAIYKQFEPNKKHVVPLSGGLDSRAILATLLELTDANNISTYTFGTPGTLDFEIGNKIASLLGTKHISFPLTEHEYTQSELINISKRVDYQTLLFLHPPVREVDNSFSDYNVWSGAIIDVFFGRHTHILKADNFNDAVCNSFSENTFVKSLNISNVASDAFMKYIDYDFKTENILSYEHVIDLLNRQVKFIAPHVLMKGYNYKTMLDKNLTDFAISIDNKFLEHQYLYKKILLKAFPYLFSLPNKTTHGLPLNANISSVYLNKIKLAVDGIRRKYLKSYINPQINYIDFNTGIRERKDLNLIIYSNIMDLKERKIIDWIDIDSIWNSHMQKKVDHANALLTLASLEIHLKAGKRL